jgi:hypothetical protein
MHINDESGLISDKIHEQEVTHRLMRKVAE